MRTDLQIDDDDLFQRRLREKEAQRWILFAPENADSEEAKAYAYRQCVVNPKRIRIGRPLFHPRF